METRILELLHILCTDSIALRESEVRNEERKRRWAGLMFKRRVNVNNAAKK